MRTKRIEWIDFCRIYTAFCVIVRHCDRHYGFPAYVADLFNYRSLIFFFFLMAGYFTHRADAGQWVDWRRTKQLLLPYLFWTLISIIALQPFAHLTELMHGDWSWLSPQLLLSETGLASWCYWDFSNVPLWYLRTLLIFAFLSPILQRMPSKMMLGVILITFAASDVLCQADCDTAASHHTRGVPWLPFRLYESVLALGFYMGGLLIQRYANGEKLTTFVRSYAWIPVAGSLLLLPAVLLWSFYPPVQSSALVLLGGEVVAGVGPRAVDQTAEGLAHVAGVDLMGDGVLGVHQALEVSLLLLGGEHVGQLRRRGALPGGVDEGEQRVKAHRLDEPQGVLELRRGLPGKAHNHIGGEDDIRDPLPEPANQL